MTQTRRSGAYQAFLVGILSLNFGILFFDRNALNFLMTFVQPDLQLSNTQIGTIAGAFAFSWAIAAFAISRISDMIGNRKLLLVISTVAFSCCSFLTGLASSFAFMLGARLLMGVAEGGVMPISHAMVSEEVDPRHRGLAQGIAQNFGSNFFGSFVAPVALVWVAQKYGWQNAFFIAGIPGIISSILMWFFIKEPLRNPAADAHRVAPAGMSAWWKAIVDAMKERNVMICVVMGILLVAYLVICWAFMQLYLTRERGFSDSDASWLMGTLGISATIGSFAISGLSDRIGRRPIMIAMPLIAAILPLGAMLWDGGYMGMVVLFFIGWGVNGTFPLFMATIPSESVSAEKSATVFGLCMGSSELIGGAAGPQVAGFLADGYGLSAPLWLMLGLTLTATIFGLGLRETAPRVLARRNGGAHPQTA